MPGRVLVDLNETAGAVAPPPSSPGLSHFAPLVPTKADVARFAQRHLDAGLDVDPRDHVVSQSCYVTDPDGHMVEVTWACPQEQWQWTDEGLPVVVSTPIAVQDLRDEPGASTPAHLPAGTHMGHVQLKATDAALTRTKPFYRDLLGLETFARRGDGFVGVGVSDYRSLLVLTNRFSPQGGTPAAPDTARLTCVDLLLTAPEAIQALAERLTAAGHPHQPADVGGMRGGAGTAGSDSTVHSRGLRGAAATEASGAAAAFGTLLTWYRLPMSGRAGRLPYVRARARSDRSAGARVETARGRRLCLVGRGGGSGICRSARSEEQARVTRGTSSRQVPAVRVARTPIDVPRPPASSAATGRAPDVSQVLTACIRACMPAMVMI